MPLSLRDYAPILNLPPSTSAAGWQSMHQAAAGMQDARQQDEIERHNPVAEQIAREAEQGQTTRATNAIASNEKLAQAKIEQDQREARLKAVGDFSKAALSGDHAAVAAMLPYLQAHGISVSQDPVPSALPDAPATQLEGGNDLKAGEYQPSLSPSLFGQPMTLRAPQAAEAPNVRSNSYRLSHQDEDLGSIDLGSMASDQAAQLAPALEQMVKGSRPEDRDARSAGMKAMLASPTMRALPAEQAIDSFGKLTEGQLQRQTSERNAQMVSTNAAKRMAGTDARAMRNYIKGIADKVKTDNKLTEVNTNLAAADKATALMASDNPISQKQAFTANLKSMFSGVTSDRELQFALSANGKWNEAEMAWNNYANGGQLPANYRELFSEASALLKKELLERKAAIGEAVHAAIVSDPSVPEDMRQSEADWAAGSYTLGIQTQPGKGAGDGAAGGGGESHGKTARGKSAEPPAAPSGGADGEKHYTITYKDGTVEDHWMTPEQSKYILTNTQDPVENVVEMKQ